jgi:DNA-binding MarR family transcriptional regulator
MMEHDPFDLGSLRVPVDPRVQRKPANAKKWHRRFVHVPWEWTVRLRAAKRVSTYGLALLLLYEHWRNGGQPIVLSNVLAADVGLPRRSKSRALAELEQLELVRMERHPRKSPRVTLCQIPRR